MVGVDFAPAEVLIWLAVKQILVVANLTDVAICVTYCKGHRRAQFTVARIRDDGVNEVLVITHRIVCRMATSLLIFHLLTLPRDAVPIILSFFSPREYMSWALVQFSNAELMSREEGA
jgi:broad specificity phosphatase PhoE